MGDKTTSWASTRYLKLAVCKEELTSEGMVALTWGVLLLIVFSLPAGLSWVTTVVLRRCYPAYSVNAVYPIVLGMLSFTLGFTVANELPASTESLVGHVLIGFGLCLLGAVAGFYAGRIPKKRR